MLLTGLMVACNVAAPSAIDLTLAEKWGNAKVIRCHVLGSFENDTTLVVNEATNGYAPVKDWLELTFDFDPRKARCLGHRPIEISPSEIGLLGNGAEGCTRGRLSKSTKNVPCVSLKEGVSVYLETVGRKNYPAAQMTVACTGGNKTVIAKQRTEHINLIIPGVMLPTMGPEANSGNVHVSPERDSITVKNGSWTFVFKSSLVRKVTVSLGETVM